jgi:mRNA-degrading endonuclease YafQ of YafQ-DinJ toxin-antitoxin module
MVTVFLTNKANKQKAILNDDLQSVLLLLVEDLKNKGSTAGVNWPNYGKFKGLKGQKKKDDWRHCHLQKGNPTYVCCWKVVEASKTIEVYYVGTHENAPY